MRTFDQGWCRKHYRNLWTNRVCKTSVFRTTFLSLCYCVSSVNLIYCISLVCCSQVSPAAILVVEQLLFLLGLHGWHSPPGCFYKELWFWHTARFWHCHLGAFHMWGCLWTLCFILPHGLLYATVQPFCNHFICWLPGEGHNLIRHSVIVISSGKVLHHWTENVLLTFSSPLDQFSYTRPHRRQT